ncbi:hypothetical protein FQZ97_1013850 [compost metagenome]
MQVVDSRQALLQGIPGRIAFGNQLAAFLDVDQVAVEVAPLATLECSELFRRAQVAQPLPHHPGEVGAVQVAVTHLEQLAGHELAAFGSHRQAGRR